MLIFFLNFEKNSIPMLAINSIKKLSCYPARVECETSLPDLVLDMKTIQSSMKLIEKVSFQTVHRARELNYLSRNLLP